MTTASESSEQGAPLRVAMLTRTRRPSGAHLAAAIARSRHPLCGILAERRGSLVARFLKRRSGAGLCSTFGPEFWRARFARAPGAPSAPALADTARSAHAPCLSVSSLNAASSVTALQQWKPDVLMIANAPVLRRGVLDTCGGPAINFHSGRLPEYGGLESEFWALYDGQSQAWVTLHEASVKLDSGDILAEEPVTVATGETPETLHLRCIEQACAMLPALLDRLAAGNRDPARSPGPAQLRPWPTNAQRRELRLRG